MAQKNGEKKNTMAWIPAAVAVLLLIASLIIARYVMAQAGEASQTVPQSDLISPETEENTPQAEPTEKTREEKLAYINENPEQFQTRLVEIANQNPDTVDFVYGYVFGAPESDLFVDTDTVSLDTVPLFFQWDSRWGYSNYAGGLMGYTGCGPTCLAMAAVYLTKNREYTPLYVARYAVENGYSVDGHGTAWSLMGEGCKSFGLLAEELSPETSRVKAALAAGEPVICIMGPGDFTETGHFIVLTGYTQEGFTVNDPFSAANSSRVWPFEDLLSQTRGIWAYCAA